MNNKIILNLDYAFIQGTYWMYYVVAGIFVSVYMLGKGYSNTSIGMVIAVGNILAVLLQAIIANIADRNERVTNITVIKAFIIALFLFTAGVLLIGKQSTLLTTVYTGLIILHTGLHPFINSLCFTLEECGEHISFGMGRSMGSFTAAVLGLAMGYLVSGFGVDVIPFSGLLVLALMEITILTIGRRCRRLGIDNAHTVDKAVEKGDAETGEIFHDCFDKADDGGKIGFLQFLTGNGSFVLVSIGVIGLFFGNVILENFTIQIVESIGGDTEQMGVVIFVMALLEMPAMLFFDRIKAHFSYVTLIRISAVFFLIKIVMMTMADSMLLIYIAQLNQILGYGLMFPAMVGFIDDIMSKGEAVRGQAMFTTAITVGNVIGCVAGGRILDMYTPKLLLITSSAVTAAGAAVICLMAGKIKSADRSEERG